VSRFRFGTKVSETCLMLGVADYDSDDDEKLATAITTAPAAPAAPAAPSKPAATQPKEGKAGKAKKPAPAAAAPVLKDKKLQEIRKEIDSARSATAVVKVVRTNMETFWDVRWGAVALYQVAKRSTARTRKEWGEDASIKKLAAKLIAATADTCTSLSGEGLDTLLIALDGLRRMEVQEADEQKAALERAVVSLVAEGWKRPVKLLARLCWLGAPLKLEGTKDFSTLLPVEIRVRSLELDGADLALLVAAMQHAGARDELLLEKVMIRMRSAEVAPEVLYKGLSGTDLVDMAEGLKNCDMTEEAAIRPLGLEVLRRRGELTPYESHRVHSAFETMKLPLPTVWMQPGSQTKRNGAEIVTTQAFRPGDGHDKKRRGNNDVERTSPPRVVRDYKMMSY